jgi:hypothetical protein
MTGGKLFLHDGAVDNRQILANDADLLFAIESKEIGFQGRFGATESDVVDAVILQIAEGSGEALLASEEVFVDAQHLGAEGRMMLARSPLRAPQEIPLYGSGADTFASS